MVAPDSTALRDAAPELLAALEWLAEIADDQLDGEFPEAIQSARAAIAKARGQ